jgi:hypothetical protein
MPTNLSVNEPPSPQDRTRAFAEGGKRAAIGLLIAFGLVCLMVGTVYLNSLIGPADLADLAQFAGP